MAYVGPRGIPLSTFLSWEQSDQDAALAWQIHENERCRGCGWHPDDGPQHNHVDICPNCVQLARTRESDDAKATGAHIHAATGTAGQCPRCKAVIEANNRR